MGVCKSVCERVYCECCVSVCICVGVCTCVSVCGCERERECVSVFNIMRLLSLPEGHLLKPVS